MQHRGMTLIETMVVVGIIAALVGFGAPAVRALLNSFQSRDVTRTMVEATLNTARTLAMSRGACVGVRFQKSYNPAASDPNDPDTAQQYMTLVINDRDRTGLATGFRAVQGHKPVRLPEFFGVTDLVRGGSLVQSDADVEMLDITSFTIVFSPAGKLVIREVRVSGTLASDRVFNSVSQIETLGLKEPVFVQDSDSSASRHGEYSRDRFYVYDRRLLKQAADNDHPWEEYLRDQVYPRPLFISPYTGQLVGAQP